MLAYLSWHRPAPEIETERYERALTRFHRSLAHQPPSGFRGSASFRVAEFPWAGGGGGYEDWYLQDGWSAIGVLEEAAVSRGHLGAHDDIAALSGFATGAVYRLAEGHAQLASARVGVWVKRARGHDHPSLGALLGDGMDRSEAGLWRRCIGLGPAPEYCLLAPEAPAGVSRTRLPLGWEATIATREVLSHG